MRVTSDMGVTSGERPLAAIVPPSAGRGGDTRREIAGCRHARAAVADAGGSPVGREWANAGGDCCGTLSGFVEISGPFPRVRSLRSRPWALLSNPCRGCAIRLAHVVRDQPVIPEGAGAIHRSRQPAARVPRGSRPSMGRRSILPGDDWLRPCASSARSPGFPRRRCRPRVVRRFAVSPRRRVNGVVRELRPSEGLIWVKVFVPPTRLSEAHQSGARTSRPLSLTRPS